MLSFRSLSAQNLRAPPSFYPTARHFSRQVYLHAGPPNSGKTAEAVKALLGASTGCYLAPLRLLAWEVYTRLKQEGKKVSLITGQERRVCKVCSFSMALLRGWRLHLCLFPLRLTFSIMPLFPIGSPQGVCNFCLMPVYLVMCKSLDFFCPYPVRE